MYAAQVEERAVVVIEPLPKLAAEGHVGVGQAADRYVLDRIPEILALSGVAQIREIVIKAVRLVGRRFLRSRPPR